MTAAITFAKLNSGDWGLRGPATQLISGATVTVAKKSGETKQLVVGRILYSRGGPYLGKCCRCGAPLHRDCADGDNGHGGYYCQACCY
jgi:hypothetical protein